MACGICPASLGDGLADGLREIEALGLGESDGLGLGESDGDTDELGLSEGDDSRMFSVGVTAYVTLVVAPFSNTRNVSVSPFARLASISSTV